MEVNISNESDKGKIVYDEEAKTITVSFPDQKVARKIKRYLNKEREFNVTGSDRINDYRIEVHKPIESLNYLERTLTKLRARFGVHVDW